MLLNYIRLSIRVILRNRLFSLINILGLSLGFAAFFVLWQYASNELKSDQFHHNYKNKLRLVFNWKTKDDLGNVADNMHGLFAPEFPQILASEYSDFETYTRLYHQTYFSPAFIGDHGQEIFLTHINQNEERIAFKEENLAYVDPNFFDFFSFSIIEGASETVLKDPSSIVISESMARKYFGQLIAINNTLLLNDSIALKVTGVFKDLPQNTHVKFDAVITTNRIKQRFDKSQEGDGVTVYFQVKPNSNREELNEKIDLAAKKFLAPAMSRLDIDPLAIKFFVQPLEEIAYSKMKSDIHKHRSQTLLTTLQIVALVILITAWINYLNLVTYTHRKRMIELGVRKTSGAKNLDFVFQFIVESLVMNSLSILGAITIVQCTKTPLQNFFQVSLSAGGGVSVTAILIIAMITLSGIIITGIYPALTVMKKSARNIITEGHLHNFYVGKFLTVFQFSIAIILMIGVFTIYHQLNFVLNKDLGLRRDEVVVLDLPENPNSYSTSNLDAFFSQLSLLSGVSDFALSSSVPGDHYSNGIGCQRTAGSTFVGTDTNGGVDERFLPFFNIKLLAGRNFINGNPINKHAIIVSKKVLRRLGLGSPEEAVGQTILVEAKGWTHDMRPTEIIGVIDDYDRKPLLTDSYYGASNDEGVALTYYDNVDAENTPRKVSMIINHKTFDGTLSQVEKLYKETFSRNFFHWYFLDDNLNQHYQNEKTTRNQIMLFVFLAIIIACLGLLGMITNKAKEKTKEIGIRKVLGAHMQDVAKVLLSTTIRQIAIAMVIGIPAAHFLVQEYLVKYSERITLRWWHYLAPVLALLLILFMTTASTLRKAARTNPADSLRCE